MTLLAVVVGAVVVVIVTGLLRIGEVILQIDYKWFSTKL